MGEERWGGSPSGDEVLDGTPTPVPGKRPADGSPSISDILMRLGPPALVGAVLYAFGFVVVQSNLVRWGFPWVGEFRAHYVAAGCLFLLLSGGPGLLGYVGYVVAKRVAGPQGESGATPGASAGLSVASFAWPAGIVALGVAGYIAYDSCHALPGRLDVVWFAAYGIDALVCGMAIAAFASGRAEARERLWLSVPLFLLCMFYAGWIHPRVPVGWGGGLGSPAVVHLDDAGPLRLPAARPPSEKPFAPGAGRTVRPCVVLDQTASTYLVLLDVPQKALEDFCHFHLLGPRGPALLRGTACEVPKTKVQSIIYLPWKTEWEKCGGKGCLCGEPPSAAAGTAAGAAGVAGADQPRRGATGAGSKAPRVGAPANTR